MLNHILKYGEIIGEKPKSWLEHLKPPATPQLKTVFASFWKNVIRNEDMLALPIRLNAEAMIDQSYFDQAVVRHGGADVLLNIVDIGGEMPLLNAQWSAIRLDVGRSWDRYLENDPEMKKYYALGKANINGMDDPLKIGRVEQRNGLEAILSAGILGTWTAFEALTGDLWASAVNANPSVLGALEGSPAKRIVNKSKGKVQEYDKPVSLKKEEVKTIPLPELLEYAMTWKEKMWEGMGELLRERFAFTKLSGIREAYATAFPANWNGITSEGIDKVLSDKSIDELSAFRNVIVHKAGIIDAKAKESLKLTEYNSLCIEGEKVGLTAAVVRSLIDPVVIKCGALISEVDNWLIQTTK